MTLLKRYAEHVLKSRGMEHLPAIDNLRHYMRETPVEKLCEEMGLLHDIMLLRTLQEAGVPKNVWNCYLHALNEEL